MIIEIKHRYTGAVLWSCEAADLRDAVEQAAKVHTTLSEANLSEANLYGARNVPTQSTTPTEPYERKPRRTLAERAKAYRERHPEVPVVPSLDAKILAIVDGGKGQLEMGRWHTCETTHCRAGWAIHLADEAAMRVGKKA